MADNYKVYILKGLFTYLQSKNIPKYLDLGIRNVEDDKTFKNNVVDVQLYQWRARLYNQVGYSREYKVLY